MRLVRLLKVPTGHEMALITEPAKQYFPLGHSPPIISSIGAAMLAPSLQ